MKREERVFRIRPLAVSQSTANSLVAELNSLATERVGQEFEQRLRVAYKADRAGTPNLDPEARTEDEFVRRNLGNQEFRTMAQLPTNQSYVFLANSGNVSFDFPDFHVEDLPRDVHFVRLRADGINGRFIEVQLKADFKDFNEARNWATNQLLVQGEDRNWVHGVYERLRLLIEPERLATRKTVYGNILTLFWVSVVLLLFGEYRIAKWLYPTFDLKEPLSGTGALVMFGILLGTVLAFGNFALPIYSYWFPYFEIEGNVSRGRLASRKVILGVASAIYTGALVNMLSLVFGSVFTGWISHK